MLYKSLIWLKWRHPYNGALLYTKNIFHFLTFQSSKLPKRAAKLTKNMTSFPCFVQSADILPYIYQLFPFLLPPIMQSLIDTTSTHLRWAIARRNAHRHCSCKAKLMLSVSKSPMPPIARFLDGRHGKKNI